MLKFEPNKTMKLNAHINSIEEYDEIYKHSNNNPEEFWSEEAERISRFKKWNNVWEWN